MCEHKDPLFFDIDMSESIDSPLDQTEVQMSQVRHDDRIVADPMTTATLLLKSRTIQRDQFQDSQLHIDDMSWHILLDLLVSAQAGKRITMHDLIITHGLAKSAMSRYVEYLIGVGMIIKDTDASAGEHAALKLTASGEDLTSNALRKIGDELLNL